MAEADGEPETLDPNPSSPQILKRKAEAEPLGERGDARKPKESRAEVEDVEEEVSDANGSTHNGKGKAVLTAADKGKGKMIEEEEEEEEEEEGDVDEGVDDGESDESSGGDSGDEIGLEEDGDDSDFCDDPLAEVDLDNILPSRTRRKAPPPPGAYLIPDQDGDDDDDDEDESD